MHQKFGAGASLMLERVETKALKLALGLGDRVSITAIRWWLGRRPLASRFWKNAYGFWALLSGCKGDRLEHHALSAAWDLYDLYKTGWIFDMVQVFLKIKFIQTYEEASLLRQWSKERINKEWCHLSVTIKNVATSLSRHPP